MKKRFVYYFFRKKDIKKISTKLEMFGLENNMNYLNFILFRIIFSILFLIISSFIFNIFSSIILAVVFYYMFYYYLIEYKLKIRSTKLEEESLYFFEILTLSLENNNSFEKSLDITCSNIDSSISSEFKEVLYRIKLGKSITESLQEMKNKIPSENINNTITNIIESIKSGYNLVEIMHNQSDFLREKYILSVKEKINKIPTKVSVYSVIIFLPLMFLLIITPVILEFLIN